LLHRYLLAQGCNSNNMDLLDDMHDLHGQRVGNEVAAWLGIKVGTDLSTYEDALARARKLQAILKDEPHG